MITPVLGLKEFEVVYDTRSSDTAKHKVIDIEYSLVSDPVVTRIFLEPFWAGLLTIFQGGIVEELWLRFGIMTFIVWLLSFLFARKSLVKPAWIYVTAIILAAFLFGVGHLPAAPLMYVDVTAILTIRIIVANMIAGLFFGYLYWKKGLEHAIIAHMVGDLVLHAFLN